VLTDAATAQRLGTAARATVAQRYSFDRMVDAFESLYESELAGRVGHADQAQHPIEETLAARRL
jgi:hypothetical protein